MDILDSNRSKIYHRDFTSTIIDNPFNYSATMQLAHQFDTTGKEFTINLDYSNYQNKPTQNNLTRLLDAHNNFISETGVLLLQQRQLNIYAAKADYVHPLKNNGRLEAGLKSSYVKAVNDNNYYQQEARGNVMDSTQSDYSVNSENINAAYVNFNQAYKKITVEAGLRAEQTMTQGKQLLTGEFVHQTYLQLFPALFLNYKLNDRHTFNIQLGRRTERAAYAEMVPFRRPLTATLFFQGNPNLKPHLSYHGETTWSYKSAFFITVAYDIDQDYVQTMPYLDSNKTTISIR